MVCCEVAAVYSRAGRDAINYLPTSAMSREN
jgi:hypothetical protein